MVEHKLYRQRSGEPLMQVIPRITSVPLVDSGLTIAKRVYQRVKSSNRLLNRGFETAETITYAFSEAMVPVLVLIEKPLNLIDNIMCKGVSIVERKMPSMFLPPEMMFWNTKEYMSDRLVRPVLSRANSMKNLGPRVSNYATGRWNGALNVCDRYVDRYLPADPEPEPVDQPDGAHNAEQPAGGNPQEAPAVQPMQRSKQITRKLKRRLTFRTRQELMGLKKHSTEAVHVVFYAAELIATNPRLAVQKGVELWQYLSADEPENQARPKTLEQLLVLLTREGARKMVHLINFTAGTAMKVPKKIRSYTHEMAHHMLYATDRLIKVAHLEKAKTATITEATGLKTRLQHTYEDLQNQTNLALERLAVFLSGRLEAEKITTSDNPRRRIQNRANNNPMHSSINGVY